MKSLPLIIVMDDDGHFQCANKQDRLEVIKIIKDVCNGDHYINTINDNDIKEVNPWTYSLNEWDEFIHLFIQRGMCELILI